MNLLSILLDSAAPQATGSGGGIISFLPIIAIVVIFYFFMIRPQQKKQKDIQKAREAIKAGDRVVTAGGIFAKVKEVSDKHMLLEISDGVRVKIDKNSVFASQEDVAQK
ncbi:MAG: preprotein translocase subunit YajC [Tannerellaceae bacterium]|jgi:preprotein translocase subunit YajC|nr:preprotein translocase subunit YajC [Tannerellaceae bacterium]